MLKWIFSLTIVGFLFVLQLVTFLHIPEAAPMGIQTQPEKVLAETGTINMVSAILYDYRALDTLGESVVIFTASLILALLAMGKPSGLDCAPCRQLVTSGVDLVIPFIVVIGLYISIFGHLSPGGGFTGGAILASAATLVLLTNTPRVTSIRLPIGAIKHFEISGLGLLLFIGMIGFVLTGVLFANQGAGIPIGTPGFLLSGGFIPIFSIVVGIKVAVGLILILYNLARED